MRFEGTVAVVTGAGRGIGAATAASFAREGASVVIADIDGEAATLTGKAIEAAGGTAVTVCVDVATSSGAEAVVDAARSRFGRLDTLVNCAGTVESLSLLDTTEEAWDQMLDSNLKSVFLTCRSSVDLMRETGGSIVNVSSIGAYKPVHGKAAYGAAKAAVVQFTRIIALELGELGIRANCVSPGPIDTEMFRATVAASGGSFNEGALPLGRVGDPAEVAATILFLSSPEAAFITGAGLTIDGGSTVGSRSRAARPVGRAADSR